VPEKIDAKPIPDMPASVWCRSNTTASSANRAKYGVNVTSAS